MNHVKKLATNDCVFTVHITFRKKVLLKPKCFYLLSQAVTEQEQHILFYQFNFPSLVHIVQKHIHNTIELLYIVI